MRVPELERFIGIEVYATPSSGIGGVVREDAEDFVVEEVLADGSRAEINRSPKGQALNSSSATNQYLLCVLTKRNWDMFMALRNVAKQLRVKAGHIQIAGIKDARAVTAQYVTIKGLSAEDVQEVHVKDIEVRPIGYLRNALSAYYLLGNDFRIKIKALRLPESTVRGRITRTIEELDTIGGIPNFFGHQRFGTTRPITHLVGKAIVKRNFKKAAMLFLAKPSPNEHPSSRQVREELRKTQDFKRALKVFPKQLRYERFMLQHLADRPDDYVGAFRMLPAKLRGLFVQAYQAYLFNRFLSRRIAHGLSLNVVETGDYAVNVQRSGLAMVTMHKIISNGARAGINDAVKAGRMRLAIPLPGFKQALSQGMEGGIEGELLEEEGVSPQGFRIAANPEMSVRGELRAALSPVSDFSLDELSQSANNPSEYQAAVRFRLCRGSYATVLLRELMKPRNMVKAGF